MAKIFISYNSKDRTWADWIGVTLRDKGGHTPFVFQWEVGAGFNIPRWMEQKIDAADHLLGEFTDTYSNAVYSSQERWAALWRDPEGKDGFLVPVEVERVTKWPSLARPLNRLSLVGRSEEDAEKALLDFLKPPKPPDKRPPFPGKLDLPDAELPAQFEPKGTVVGKTSILMFTVRSFTDRSEPLPKSRPALPTGSGATR